MTSHELNRAFDATGLPLCQKLREMLDEHPSHRTVRRGCGLTQSTRFLSVYVNAQRDRIDCDELGMFEAWKQHKHVSELAQQALAHGWEHGWRGMSQAPDAIRNALFRDAEMHGLVAIDEALSSLHHRLKLPESRILLDIIKDLLLPTHDVPQELPRMAQKPEIGSCSQAEEFFLEIAHGKIRRGGTVNVITDQAGQATMIEKVNLGESHSAIILRPCRLNGVWLAPGSLAALSYADADLTSLGTPSRHGHVLPASALHGVYYMRLTTLGVPPSIRKRAFSVQFERQLSANMLSPHSTTIEDLVGTADELVAATR